MHIIIITETFPLEIEITFKIKAPLKCFCFSFQILCAVGNFLMFYDSRSHSILLLG